VAVLQDFLHIPFDAEDAAHHRVDRVEFALVQPLEIGVLPLVDESSIDVAGIINLLDANALIALKADIKVLFSAVGHRPQSRRCSCR